MNLAIKNIAIKVLGLETLVTRNSDECDFYDLPVWQVKKALEDAYEAGRAHGVRSTLAKKS